MKYFDYESVAREAKLYSVEKFHSEAERVLAVIGKPWKYALIPHDAIAENMTLVGLVGRFG